MAKNKTKNKAILTGKIEDGSVLVTEHGLFNIVPVSEAVKKEIEIVTGQVTILGSFLRKRIEGQEKITYRTEVLVSKVGPSQQGVNSIELCGFLGREPHIAYPPDDTEPIVTLSIGTTDYRPDPDKKGSWLKETTWHKSIAKGELAVTTVEKMKKGSFSRVEGRLVQRRGKRGTVAEVMINGINGVQLTAPVEHEEKFQRMLTELQEKQSSPLIEIEEPEIIIIDLA